MVDTYCLHNSDTSVRNETFADGDDEEDFSSVRLDSTRVRQSKRNNFVLVRLLYDAGSNKKVQKYFITQVIGDSSRCEPIEVSYLRKT